MNTGANPPRSDFVTVLAWIFIVLSGFTTLISGAQNILIRVMLSEAEPATNASESAPLSGLANWMTAHIELLFAGFLVAALVTLITSIALLRRKRWGRVSFIGIMVLAIAWMMVGLPLQWVMLADMPGAEEADSVVRVIRTVIKVFNTIIALGMTVVFAWIIKKLVSPDVRAEFE
jgi:hypothetical protein